MKQFSILTIIIIGLIACQAEGVPEDKKLSAKKAKLERLLVKKEKLREEIQDLEKEIRMMDTNAVTSLGSGVLVTSQILKLQTFEHYVEVQGTAESDENVLMSSEMGGMVQKVLVMEGDHVQAGQLLVALDEQVITNNIEELKVAHQLASTIYQKQKNLWDQKIGSEIQYLQAKNQMESLEKKLQSAQAQWEKTQTKAPFNGTIDEIFVKEGEMAVPGNPILRVVNLHKVYVKADVSEAYVGSFKKGDSVKVEFLSINREFKARISAVGQFIHPMNRTFKVEVKLANKDLILKPNLLGIIHLRSEVLSETLVVPTKYIQQDKGQNFVFVAEKTSKGTQAQKKNIEIGLSYRGSTVVTYGLEPNAELIAEGSRTLVDGDIITIKN